MLYDVVPPLIFIGSLGGIIFIISRVVTRLHRHELSAVLQSAATIKTPSSSGQLRPTQSNIRLFGSRLSLLKPLLSAIGVQAKRATLVTGRLAVQAWNHIPKKLPRIFPTPMPPTPAPTLKPTRHITKVTMPHAMPAEAVAKAGNLSKVGPKPHITKKVVSPTFFQKKPRLSELEIAQAALKQNDFAKVEEILVPYLFKHPTSAAGYVLLGQAAMQQGNWSDALEILEQAVAQDTYSPEAQTLLGISAYHAGQIARALPALQRAHDQDPTNQEVLRCLIKIAQTMDNRALVHSIELEIAALQSPSQTVAAR